MRKIFTLLTMLCLYVGASWAQIYTPGARTTTLEAGKKYFISAATYYNNARPNLLYNNKGNLAYSNNKPTGYYKSTYVFTVEKIVDGTYFIKNSDGKYLQSNNLASTETETGIIVVPYGTVKNVHSCGHDVDACDENGTFIDYNDIDENTPIVCVYHTGKNGWRHINGLEIGTSTPFAFYEAKEGIQLELTTDVNNPVYYTIKNTRGNVYAAYDGETEAMKLLPSVEGPDHLFYFTKGSTEGTYKIHTYGTDKKCADYNLWTTDGIDWYIIASGSSNYTGFAISKQATLTDKGEEAWNDYQETRTSINLYGGNNDGSVWSIEKHQGVMPGLQLSTEDNIVLHYIRSNRRTTYVNFDGHNVTFKEGNEGLNSYWYFVEDEKATGVPEGYVAVNIFNAAHPTAVEDYPTGYMEDASRSAKTFLVGLRQIKDAYGTGYGYVIYLPGETNGWHDFSGTYVGAYGLGDRGSLWRIYPANKTVDQLKNEANTAKTNALAFIANAEEADFYTYSDEAIATAKSAVEAMPINKVYDAINVLKTVNDPINTLKAEERSTTNPVAGQYIQLKNKQYGKYLKPKANGELEVVADGNDRGTLWVVEEGTDGNVKLKHAATEKYLGEIRQSINVKMVEEANAKQFAFTNPVDCYAVFHETSGGDHAYGHIASHNVLVGWNTNADATQWVVSEYSLNECLADLQEIYDVVDNAFGTKPGQYMEMEPSPSDELYMAWYQVGDALSSDVNKDVYMISLLADGLKAKWNTQLANPDSRDINLPVQGKFYRLKNVASGRYMNVKSASSVVVTDEGDNLPATIFYLGDNNTMLSYSVGQYLDCGNKNLAAVGTSKTGEFAAARSGAKPNTIMYKNNGYWTFGNRDNNVSIDRGSDKPGANVVGYDWTLEEIETLPVKITDAGYATLYAPVALKIPGDVKVYIASVNNEKTKLVLQEIKNVIPKNTGVILEGAQGTYDFEVVADVDPINGNELKGSYAKSEKNPEADVFTLQKGDYGVGFYFFKGENTNGAKTYINGFRSWLELGANSQVKSFRFDFGSTTDIENLLNTQDSDAIYDLYGRRVEKAGKGIYIVNGKKIVVK